FSEPSQDIVLGCYFATKQTADFDKIAKDPKLTAALKTFGSTAEAEMALAMGRVKHHTPIRFLVDRHGEQKWLVTTVGRVLFNAIIPAEVEVQNRDMKEKALGELVFETFRKAGLSKTLGFLDRLKE